MEQASTKTSAPKEPSLSAPSSSFSSSSSTPKSPTEKRGRGRGRGRERQREGETGACCVAPTDPEDLQELVLGQLAESARLCQELESGFGQHPAPELEMIIKLHRSLVFRLSAQAHATPEILAQVTSLMRPIMDWARLEEKRKERQLAERKYRDQAAQQAAKEQGGGGTALTPETLEKIERELKLF